MVFSPERCDAYRSSAFKGLSKFHAGHHRRQRAHPTVDASAVAHREVVRTPYGEPFVGADLRPDRRARRGVSCPAWPRPHDTTPHRVNYRANVWALQAARRQRTILAVASVGARSPRTLRPWRAGAARIQLIDYTSGRAGTAPFLTVARTVTVVAHRLSRILTVPRLRGLLPGGGARGRTSRYDDGGVYGAVNRDRGWRPRRKSTAWNATVPPS